jgi:hypothetical protein
MSNFQYGCRVLPLSIVAISFACLSSQAEVGAEFLAPGAAL